MTPQIARELDYVEAMLALVGWAVVGWLIQPISAHYGWTPNYYVPVLLGVSGWSMGLLARRIVRRRQQCHTR